MRHLALAATSVALFAPTAAAAQEPAGEGEPAWDAGGVIGAPVPEDTDGYEEEAAPPADVPDEGLERQKLQAAGIGYHGVFFRSEVGDRYALHGPSVTYDYFVGRRWGFAIHGEAYFPFFGRYSGRFPDFRGGLRETYTDLRYGLDVSLLAAYRLDLTDELLFIGAGGFHIQSFTVDSTDFAIVQAITMGIGGLGRLQWNFHPMVVLNADLLVAFDPLDLIRHQNRATIVIPLAASVTLGVRYGSER